MTKETTYEKRTWVKGDRPGASDFNRIEAGVESAHERVDQLIEAVTFSAQDGSTSESIDLVTAKYREIEYLPDNAKVADLVATVNKLLSVLRKEENQGDGAD